MALEIGDTAPSFSLVNANPAHGGEELSLEGAFGTSGLVVVFECNHCPYVVASVARMNTMSEFCHQNKIGFVGINSNDPLVYENDSFENMQKRANKGMPYSYLHDLEQNVARAYGAKRTPEFFLFDASRSLVYKGRMDDSPKDPSDVSVRDLNDAIAAMLNGDAPKNAVTESIGCSVKWKS